MRAVLSILVSITLAAPGLSLPQSPTISIDSGTSFQVHAGWEATIGPDWVEFKDDIVAGWGAASIDKLTDELGINRVRFPIFSNMEHTTDLFQQYLDDAIPLSGPGSWYESRGFVVNDNADPDSIDGTKFHFTYIDYIVDNIITPMRQNLIENGDNLHVSINFNEFEDNFFYRDNPNEYAEAVLALYQHLNSTYGWVPDSITPINEPNVGAIWSAAQVGDAILAIGAKLAGAGFGNVHIIAPDCSSSSASVTYYGTLDDVAGIFTYLKTIGWHNYPGTTLADKQAFATEAASRGINTGMHEHIDADYVELHEDITQGNVSSWQQFVAVFPTTDNGAQYYTVTLPSTLTIAARAKLLRQYFKSVRLGAVRKGASTSNGTFQPVAYLNSDGRWTVIVKASNSGSFSIGNLPAGEYTITYATTTTWNQSHPNQTIGAGENISTSIPGVGVLTVTAVNGAAQSGQAQTTGKVTLSGNVRIQ